MGGVSRSRYDCFTFGGLSPSTSYSLTVAARDAAGNVSDQSQAVTVTTTASNPSPPDAPSGLTVTASSFTTATLAWNPPNAWGQSVSGYVVSQDGAPILTVPRRPPRSVCRDSSRASPLIRSPCRRSAARATSRLRARM